MTGVNHPRRPGCQPVTLCLAACWWLVVVSGACGAPRIESRGAGGSGGAGGSTGGAAAPAGGTSGAAGFGVVWSDGGSDAPSTISPEGPLTGEKCAEEVHMAQLEPLDLLLLVDSSGSMMESAGASTKWQMAHDALGAFVKDPQSAALGVGLQFFPFFGPPKACMSDGDCNLIIPRPNIWCHVNSVCLGPGVPLPAASDCEPGFSMCPAGTTCTPLGRCSMSGADCVGAGQPCPGGMGGDVCVSRPKTCQNTVAVRDFSCAADDYQRLVVPIAPLPGAQAALTAALDFKRPNGGTPLGPAVQGALRHLQAHLAASAGRQAALVLATDGLPDGCDGDNVAAVAATLQAARVGAQPISSYVIGVFNQMQLVRSQSALAMLATAGGTGSPFVLMPGDDLSKRFLEALNQIRGKALACEFKIPPPTMGQLDYGKVNVRIEGVAGAQDLVYVGAADRCDPARGGWFYDVDPATGTPTRILVCEATCQRLKESRDTKVDLRFGCKSRVIQ